MSGNLWLFGLETLGLSLLYTIAAAVFLAGLWAILDAVLGGRR